jgi:dephospho-CoA kinase
LKDLENIVHPLVRSKTNQIIDQHTSETIIVNEIPLLLEKKMESLFDFLVIVISSEKNRLERLSQRGLTTEQATARMSKQVSDDERKAAADFLIVNDGNLDQLEVDVEKIWQTLQERSFKS